METALVMLAAIRTEQKRPGRCCPALPAQSVDQDAFFLRSASTNLISSMVPSQSLVVAGLNPFFWPSDRRSNAALSLLGDSKNAFAIAAFKSSGRSEL